MLLQGTSEKPSSGHCILILILNLLEKKLCISRQTTNLRKVSTVVERGFC